MPRPDAILADGRTWRYTTNGSIPAESSLPWVEMSDLARRGAAVVREGYLHARPEEWSATFGPRDTEPSPRELPLEGSVSAHSLCIR